MAKSLIINSIQISNAIAQASVAASILDTEKVSWTDQGESSLALDAFEMQFADLQDVMQRYQTLLQKDLEAASRVCQELAVSDFSMSTIWK